MFVTGPAVTNAFVGLRLTISINGASSQRRKRIGSQGRVSRLRPQKNKRSCHQSGPASLLIVRMRTISVISQLLSVLVYPTCQLTSALDSSCILGPVCMRICTRSFIGTCDSEISATARPHEVESLRMHTIGRLLCRWVVRCAAFSACMQIYPFVAPEIPLHQ